MNLKSLRGPLKTVYEKRHIDEFCKKKFEIGIRAEQSWPAKLKN